MGGVAATARANSPVSVIAMSSNCVPPRQTAHASAMRATLIAVGYIPLLGGAPVARRLFKVARCPLGHARHGGEFAGDRLRDEVNDRCVCRRQRHDRPPGVQLILILT